MKMNSKMMGGAVAALVLFGCGGSSTTPTTGGVGDIGSGQKGHAAKFVLVNRMVFKDATNYANVKAQHFARMTADGASFNDAARAITLAPVPIAGRFVKLGNRVYAATDSTGIAKLPQSVALVPNALIVGQASDTKGWAFNATQMGPIDKPTTIAITKDSDGENLIWKMDPVFARAAMKGEEPPGCVVAYEASLADKIIRWVDPKRNCFPDPDTDCGALNTCCQTYDGYLPSNRKPTSRAEALLRFPGSTCWRWYINGVCNPPSTGVAGDEGICYQTHRGRWCQEIKEGAAEKVVVGPSNPAQSFKVVVGDTIDFNISNDTRMNTVVVQLDKSDHGQVSSATTIGGGSGQQIELKFWDDVGGTCVENWVGTRNFRFTAALPAGQDTGTVTISVLGYPSTTTFQVEICR